MAHRDYIPVSSVKNWFPGFNEMLASSTFRGILAEGAILEAKRILRRLGEKRFGRPDVFIEAAIKEMNEISDVERFIERVLIAKNWHELMEADWNEYEGDSRRTAPPLESPTPA